VWGCRTPLVFRQTWLILIFISWGYNAPEHALLHDGYAEEEFWPAYEKMTDKLRPWTIDFHVAQNDGQVHWCWLTRQNRQALPRQTIRTVN
jgi:hypothetical protein